jgi:hypothetical protein
MKRDPVDEPAKQAAKTKKQDVWEMRLYVAGQTPHSTLAFANLKKICETHLAGKYSIEAIDLLENPKLAAIPQPSGETSSKRPGSLEMPALGAEGEIRDERFWPGRGKNQGIGHTTATSLCRRAGWKLRGRAVPKANVADHGDRADGMKSR